MAISSAPRHHFLLLATCTLLLVTFSKPTLSAQRCPDCGATPVPYPLSIGPTCGDQLYKLRCSAGSLLFDTLNNTYPVTSVSPQLQRLTIQPSPFLAFQHHQQQHHLVPQLYPDSVDLSFELSVSDGGACENSKICCTFRAGGSATSYSIRVRDAGCRAYRAFVNLDYSLPVSRWPQPGLELQWVSPSEPICRKQTDCDSESTCGLDPNSNSGVRRCFCNSGLHWDAIAGSCSKGKKDFLEAAETLVQWTLRVWVTGWQGFRRVFEKEEQKGLS
nr:wall-associated receptor kinase-like 20 [Coffea arabica]